MKTELNQLPEIVIVGSRGYLGAFLEGYFRSRGYAVVGVSSADCDFLQASAVEALFSRFDDRPRVILFLQVINKGQDNSFEAYQSNVQMVKNLLTHISETSAHYLVYASSVDVYGSHPPAVITESSPIAPDTWYGLAKYSCEWMIGHNSVFSQKSCVLRFPGIFGPAPNDKSVIGKLVRSFREEGRAILSGQGTVRRDFVSTSDIARLIEMLTQKPYCGVLNVVRGQSERMIDVAKITADILKVPFAATFVEADPGRDFDLVFDSAKLRTILPGFSFSSLADGIRDYL